MIEFNSFFAILFLILSIALALLLYLLVLFIKNRQDLNRFKKAIYEQKEQILEEQKSTKKRLNKETSELNRFLAKIDEKLVYAGLSRLNSYAFLMIVFTFAMIGAFLFYFLLQNMLAVLIGLLLFGYLPLNILNLMIDIRASSFNIALSEAMSILVRMMRNGVGFEQALKKAVDISSSKLFREIFTIYLKEKDLIGDELAFEKMSKNVNSNEARIFALSIMIGKSSGGKFSNTLEKLEESIKDRVKLQRKVTVATREAKVGSYMIIGIIAVIFVMMNESLKGKLVEYFFQTDSGRLEFMFVLLWVGLGLFLNSMMTKVR